MSEETTLQVFIREPLCISLPLGGIQKLSYSYENPKIMLIHPIISLTFYMTCPKRRKPSLSLLPTSMTSGCSIGSKTLLHTTSHFDRLARLFKRMAMNIALMYSRYGPEFHKFRARLRSYTSIHVRMNNGSRTSTQYASTPPPSPSIGRSCFE